MTKWAVGEDRDSVLLAPRAHGVLDRARSQIIEDLITEIIPLEKAPEAEV